VRAMYDIWFYSGEDMNLDLLVCNACGRWLPTYGRNVRVLALSSLVH
jgi:hypothetical protein